MKPVAIGLAREEEVWATPSDLASALGNTGVHVVSSPATIGFLEMACHNALRPFFDVGEGSVGVGFELRHVGAARLGAPIRAAARLVESDGRRFTFEVEARQGDRAIMTGRHQRAVVELDRLLKRERPAEPVRLTFWFDVHSPWAHLAAHRIGDLARKHGACLTWKPLSLPRLIEAIGGRRPLEANPAFVAWYRQDLDDWSRLLRIETRYHPGYPLRNARALRACLLAADQGVAEGFVTGLMRAYWSEARDISDLDVLADIGVAVGLVGDEVKGAATSAAMKARLAADTEEAIARGVFGVPTVDTGAKLYFGNDRLDLLDRHLTEQAAAALTP